jgi:hypothetical protein
MSAVLLGSVTLAMLNVGGPAVVLKETSPARFPVPPRTSCTNSETASLAASILWRPVPSSSCMLPERSITSITSRVMGGGGVGAICVRMVAVGKYRSWEPEQGLPLDSTPTMRPAASNKPEPELPPDTWKVVGTRTPIAPLAVTAANDACGKEIFWTAPFGWWIPNTCSPTSGRSCRS